MLPFGRCFLFVVCCHQRCCSTEMEIKSAQYFTICQFVDQPQYSYSHRLQPVCWLFIFIYLSFPNWHFSLLRKLAKVLLLASNFAAIRGHLSDWNSSIVMDSFFNKFEFVPRLSLQLLTYVLTCVVTVVWNIVAKFKSRFQLPKKIFCFIDFAGNWTLCNKVVVNLAL